ncbi:type II toxin-antitoxin system RelE/ParE family toxin [Demequina aurantiaca]|uniref:type II toxin-antitoxin system RelE/ParE family toxin n=1 Tax=Demequina aurantiaca TaxID=676200 RepID=UPI0007840A1C|nr:hypothetical protein [Demequina aurantiaca]
MEVAYDDPKLEALLGDERALRKGFGAPIAGRLGIRFSAINAASSLAELHRLPGRTHPLKGNRSGQYAMELPQGFRLIIRPTDPVPTLQDGGIDINSVTRVTVVEISKHYS